MSGSWASVPADSLASWQQQMLHLFLLIDGNIEHGDGDPCLI